MGNICRIFTSKSIQEIEHVKELPCVQRYGDDAIQSTETGTVIYSINSIQTVVDAIGEDCIVQDLDAYGIDQSFICKPSNKEGGALC